MTDKTSPSLLTWRLPFTSSTMWLIVMFATLVGLKSYWILNSTGPTIFGDEFLYMHFAQRMFTGQPYDHYAHYPPMYPLSLSLAFLSKTHWYETMLFINTLLSSSILFPVYLISKRMLPGHVSFLPVIMVALLPFHAVYPSLLISENLFLLVFLFSVYVSLIWEKRNWLAGVLVGVSSAVAYMTKYLFLPSIPFLLGLWWLTPLFNKDLKGNGIDKNLHLSALAAVTTGFLLVYSPWLFYAHYSGLTLLREAMGLENLISYVVETSRADIRISGARADVPNLESLVLWLAAYGSYMVLLLAPVLSILCLYVRLLLSKKADIPFRERLFVFSLIVLSIGYFLLAVQHSWGAEYNYPEPNYLLGRYLLHLTPLYFLAAVIALYRISNHISSLSAAFVILTSLFSLLLVYVAQHVLFEQAAWKLSPWFADIPFNSPDGFVYKERAVLWAVLIIIPAIGIGIIAGRRNNIFATRYMLPFIAGFLILFQFGAFYVVSNRIMAQRGWPLHGRLLAPVFRTDLNNGVESIALRYDIRGLSSHNLLWSLYFWLEQGPESKIVVNAIGEKSGMIPATAKQYFLSSLYSGDVYAYAYVVDGTRYYLYNSSDR